MRQQRQLPDPLRDHLIEVIGIGSLVFFGMVMVFFGWLRYKDRNNPAPKKKKKGTPRSVKKK